MTLKQARMTRMDRQRRRVEYEYRVFRERSRRDRDPRRTSRMPGQARI